MIVKPDNPEQLICLLKAKPLVLYGMGTLGQAIAKWCDSQNIEYIIADKNALLKQTSTGEAFVTPEDLKTGYMYANIIISTNIYFDEIKANLLKDGFSENQILSYELFVPKNIIWPDLEDNINWDLMRPSVELFSRWIGEDIKSVVDYGAGQMYLKTFLRPDVKYYPIDYIKRFDETIVCDLNKGEFPDLYTDAAVCNGVLEFLATSGGLLKHICEKTSKMIILSYLTVDKFPSITARRASGYISDLSEAQIVHLLIEGGFRLTKKESDPLYDIDTIYLFEK